jgi:hypothetical protein
MRDFKVLFIPRLGCDVQFEKHYDTAAEAEIALSAIAQYTLCIQGNDLMRDYANCGMVLKRDDDGDWVEVDAHGNEI